MSHPAPILPTISLHPRSLGTKLFVVMLLAFLLSIAGFFLDNLVDERAQHHGLVAASYGVASSAPTSFLGIRLADSYRSTRRSVHYITLFLGLVFLTCFLFEVRTGKRVHVAQYALVGVAQIVFYLLLLSFAEHLGFDLSFLIAGSCTVALLSANTEWVFGTRQRAVQAGGVFATLYTFIYVLLRVEAYALLVGAVAAFLAVASAMYFTRQVDWFGGSETRPGRRAPTPPLRESFLD